MPRYKLTIAYDGTDFCGWQKQEPLAAGTEHSSPSGPTGSADNPHSRGHEGHSSAHTPAYTPSTRLIDTEREGRVALRTVQGVVELAARQICRERVELVGGSRTDSGVHARGQVAAFTTNPGEQGLGWPSERGTDRLLAALNSRLPDDVQVLNAEECAADFNPIGGATSKSYSYTFHVGRPRPLWDRRYVYHLHRDALNLDAMRQAAALLIGEHDFAAFAAAGHGRLTTVRTVFDLTLTELPTPPGPGLAGVQRVRMDIAGSGFLWNMVRIISGTLMEVGLNRKTIEDVRKALETTDRTLAGPTLPPEGLCLEWIRYGSNEAQASP